MNCQTFSQNPRTLGKSHHHHHHHSFCRATSIQMNMHDMKCTLFCWVLMNLLYEVYLTLQSHFQSCGSCHWVQTVGKGSTDSGTAGFWHGISLLQENRGSLRLHWRIWGMTLLLLLMVNQWSAAVAVASEEILYDGLVPDWFRPVSIVYKHFRMVASTWAQRFYRWQILFETNQFDDAKAFIFGGLKDMTASTFCCACTKTYCFPLLLFLCSFSLFFLSIMS